MQRRRPRGLNPALLEGLPRNAAGEYAACMGLDDSLDAQAAMRADGLAWKAPLHPRESICAHRCLGIHGVVEAHTCEICEAWAMSWAASGGGSWVVMAIIIVVISIVVVVVLTVIVIVIVIIIVIVIVIVL